jgi:phosphocarrier protein
MDSPVEKGFGTVKCKVVISNQRGLHARAAAKFVKLAGDFDAEVSVAKNETVVPGGSIMALMMLAAGPGCELELRADGPQAEEALRSLERLVTDGFGEE